MSALAALLRKEIRRNGPITLARYMEAALYHSTLGYYRRRDPLGAAGDFTTAPEISQMFGEMLGAWLAAAWQEMGHPAPVRLVELGPGRGTLISDALRATRAVAGFHQAVDLHLVEISAPLRAAQAAALAQVGFAATWHDSLAPVPPGPLLLVANEFFDALAIHQYQCTKEGWRERLVTIDPNSADSFRLVLATAPCSCEPPAHMRGAAVGDVWEDSPMARAIVGAIAERLVAEGGAALIVDYGPADLCSGDSLQGLREHRRHDPLHEPGSGDITAHVDFAMLRRGAERAGAVVYGPLEQSRFLLRLGILARAERLRSAALARGRPDQATAVATAFKRLIAPTEMGSLFKVLALTDGRWRPPPGFAEPSPETA